MDYSKAYELIYLCRKTEEKIADGVKAGKIRLPIHLSIGQEFVSVGICLALDVNDIVFGTYRGHALYLSKGGDLKKMIAELHGKKSGCCSGKGGSMHIIDTSVGFMGTSGIVATGLPNAVGIAYGMQYQNKDDIVVCVFGDGAVDEGAFYESLNFASLKGLNIIFVCENNLYAIRSPQSSRQASCNIASRATPFGIPSEIIPSRTESVFTKIQEAKHQMKKDPGPRFFECFTCRWKEHLGPNDDFGEYRCNQHVDEWIKKDELKKLGEKIDLSVRQNIETKVDSRIRDAFVFAENSPYPESRDLHSDVFAGESK